MARDFSIRINPVIVDTTETKAAFRETVVSEGLSQGFWNRHIAQANRSVAGL
jgi:hypothetical protein